MVDAVRVARMAKLLEPGVGGIALESSAPDLVARVSASSGPLRLLVLSAGEGGELTGSFDGKPLPPQIDASSPTVHVVDLDGGAAGSIEIRLHEPRGILAAWVVSRVSSTGPFDLHAADK
jgi:hypothetical protein